MRLNRLDLTRYGRFSDAQIVLPKPADWAPDVTIIYGPNEAGKSTTFNAFLELLFGMKARDHPYDFRFKRSDLLVGAELDIPGRGSVVLQRNSKKSQSLLDDQNRPVDESILTAALHGVGRDTYVERFSLNDEGLRQGGARIANAQGDLGQLLHAGVSGLTTMAATLDQMTTRADQFHKKGGRSTALKAGKDRLAEIAQALRIAGLTPDKERALLSAVEKAQTAFNTSQSLLVTAKLQATAGSAAQDWFDRSNQIETIDQQLANYPSGPDLPHGTAAQVAALCTTIREKSARAAEANEKIAALNATIAAQPIDPDIAKIAAAIADLDSLEIDGAPLMARAVTAASDLDKRVAALSDLNTQISQVLADLKTPNVAAASLSMTPSDLEALTQATQAVLTAQNMLVAAQDAVTSAKASAPSKPAAPQDSSQLQTAWAAWQSVADISVAQNAVTTETARLNDATATLPQGWDALIDAGLPARDTLAETAKSMLKCEADLTTAKAELNTRETALRLAQAKLRADAASPAAIDAAAAAQARRIRNEKWAAHRATFSQSSADAFEAAMFGDDDAQAGFVDGAEARGQLATTRREEAAAQAMRDEAKNHLENITAQFAALTARCADLATALGLDPETGPHAFLERHSALSGAAQIAAQLKNAKAEFALRNDMKNEAQDALSLAAKLVELDCSKDALPAAVQAAITLENSVQRTWDQWVTTDSEITKLIEKSKQAALNCETAQRNFSALTAVLPLAGWDADKVMDALPHLRHLQALLHEQVQLTKRVRELENAIELMEGTAARISEYVAEPKGDAITQIDAARVLVTKANDQARDREKAAESLTAETRILNAAKLAKSIAQDELDMLFDGQGPDDQNSNARVSKLAERDNLRAQRREHDDARNKSRTASDPALFENELERLPDAGRAATLLQTVEEADVARLEARVGLSDAKREYQIAFDAADPSDLITEQATIIEELRSAAQRAAIARLGVLAAKSALRSLAAERRTTMLQDVENAFVTITAPSWASVDVWSESEGERLIGVQPDGTKVPVEQMSTGTMGQLYFALRVAGYHSFIRDLGPLPMILDDIMETFDDARARAALQLCESIGHSGQAVMFTHHAHLVDLARETIDGVNIVAMPN